MTSATPARCILVGSSGAHGNLPRFTARAAEAVFVTAPAMDSGPYFPQAKTGTRRARPAWAAFRWQKMQCQEARNPSSEPQLFDEREFAKMRSRDDNASRFPLLVHREAEHNHCSSQTTRDASHGSPHRSGYV